MAYNKVDFKKHIETIQVDGFKLKSAVQAYLFVRKQSDRTETITISYRSYAPHGFYIDGISADIYFNEIEDVLEKYGLDQEYKSTFGKSFQKVEGINYDLLANEINSDESFAAVKYVIYDIIKKGVIPFLEKFSSLKEVGYFLANKKAEEIVPYIKGAILLPKTALILKTTNHSIFSNKLIEFRSILQEYSSTDNYYQAYLEKYDRLFSDDLKIW